MKKQVAVTRTIKENTCFWVEAETDEEAREKAVKMLEDGSFQNLKPTTSNDYQEEVTKTTKVSDVDIVIIPF